MKQATFDQLDKFHEDLCKWDLHQEILSHVDDFLLKPMYYSTEDYILTQKLQLYSDLKTQLNKNAQRLLPGLQNRDADKYLQSNNLFQLKHCEMVKKFVVFELNQVNQNEKKKNAFMCVNQNDVVVIFRQDAHTIEKNHLIGVVDSALDGLVLLKSYIKMEEPDERSFSMGKSLTQDSYWVIEKIGSLINFNKSYLALQSFQDIDIQERLNDPANDILNNYDFYQITKSQEKQIADIFPYTQLQIQAITGSLKKKGLSIVLGDYLSGKTSLIPGLIMSFMMISNQVKLQREQDKKSKKIKTYTMKELLENESSEDEYYSDKDRSLTQFPWYQKGYKHIYDELDYSNQKGVGMGEMYPTSDQTDNKILLKPIEKDQTRPPEKIVIVSPNSLTVDNHLRMIEKLGLDKQVNILRIGHSNHDDELNKKYSIEYLSGGINKKTQKDEALDQVKEDLMRQAQIIFIAVHSLTQQLVEKTQSKHDTIIIDDASVIPEVDVLQTLKRGAVRLILLGNPKIQPNMFMLNPKSGDRTLFSRMIRALDNGQVSKPYVILPTFVQEPNQMIIQQTPKGSAKAKKGKKPEVEQIQAKSKDVEIHFIDLSNAQEKDQKESFINDDEAQSIADYLMTQQDIDLNSVAIMTPFRTQVLAIRNIFQSRDELPAALKSFYQFGSFDEYVSQTFKVVIVSMCKTKNIVKNGGPLLNSHLNVDFLKSRATEKIIVFGRAKALNNLWRHEFYDLAKNANNLTEL
eukprot:403340332